MAIIKNVRIAFAHGIFTSSIPKGGTKPVYTASFVFPPDHPAKAQIEKLIEEAGSAAFGKGWPAIKKDKLANNKLILHDGDTKTWDGFEGNLYFHAGNSTRPNIKDRDGVTTIAGEDGRIYSGCYVNAHVDIGAYKNDFGNQVSITLTGVQFVKDGDAWTGGTPVAKDSDFESLAEGADAEDFA